MRVFSAGKPATLYGPCVNFSMRRFPRVLHEQLQMITLATGKTQEEIATEAMRLGFKALNKMIAEGRIET